VRPQRIGKATLEELFTGPNVRTLLKWIRQLEASASSQPGEQSVWVPETLTARLDEDRTFPAEATLSFRELDGRRFYTLICRDVNDRLSAQQQIRALSDEAERLRRELDQGRHQGELLGRSRVMQRVREDVEEVAHTDATVLILGETGTGKEVVARAIHHTSTRRDKPMVAVNCAAIHPHLIESEFFGHERGAFTGATQSREGRFAMAHGGTIFLDEVGELPLELQGKLLRVLQAGQFEPVGSSQTRTCDVRVIAATNRDLAGAVEAGHFRQDLYYRLNVYPISLPPLRDRGDDVVLLADAFAQRIAARLGRRIKPISPEAAERLKRYPWPGNVRELENVIERGVITARDDQVNLERALPDFTQVESVGSEDRSTPTSSRVLTRRQLEEIERQNLRLALERAGGRVAGKGGAAELLGLAPSTVNSRLKALKIERPSFKP
jgi:transcriptional regulator with GAF, ATPase, and Fis domain